MPRDTQQKQWKEYRQRELETITPYLHELGVVLDQEQPHIKGERFLMVGPRDVGGGGYKLVLTGVRASDGKRVVIKISSDPNGRHEIQAERAARQTLQRIRFAYYILLSPEELHFSETHDNTLYITTYIEQEQSFLERPLREQFHLALQALKTQEGLHATTSSHTSVIQDTFGMWDAREYLESFSKFQYLIQESNDETLKKRTEEAAYILTQSERNIEQYCGFLTHADFVPHNLRITGETLYLLDHASLHFGNKHESWARFLNFMLLHNRPLEQALTEYMRLNRTHEELVSLRLMRIYKLGFLINFYIESAKKSEGKLHELSHLRIAFWSDVLASLVANTPLSEERVDRYKAQRDQLRSEEEKVRQQNLH